MTPGAAAPAPPAVEHRASGRAQSTAARRVREADEGPSLASRSTPPPRSSAQNDMVCLAVAAATAKRLPSALPRGRPVASERAAWWCCWWQILRPDRRLRPPALSSLPYRPRVIRHVRPLTEGVGEWRVATLQHTLSRERETLLSVSVLHALEKGVSARNVASEGGLDAGPERPLGARPRAQRLRLSTICPGSPRKKAGKAPKMYTSWPRGIRR